MARALEGHSTWDRSGLSQTQRSTFRWKVVVCFDSMGENNDEVTDETSADRCLSRELSPISVATCLFQSKRGACGLLLNDQLLRSSTSQDLIEALLVGLLRSLLLSTVGFLFEHEMIHLYLFITQHRQVTSLAALSQRSHDSARIVIFTVQTTCIT